MTGIAEWLAQHGLAEYAALFAEHRIDLDVAPRLTDELLEGLGIPLGDRLRLAQAIAELEATPASGTPAPPTPSGEAERRQLTILFADLVGSTELAGRLDPEALRDVHRGYQDAVTAAIESYEGYVARYMGDGVLAYFGYPSAHEDDAERAVRAGLAIVEAVGSLEGSPALDAGATLAVRVGIATGLVVVGDLIGDGAAQESAVVGETPNLAARLQGLAEPDSVLIAPATRSLLGARFEYEDLGARTVKGMGAPIHVWRVVATSSSTSRFEASRHADLTPLVGREHELGLLVERWRQAAAGIGQVVLLSGEAGIGKSRMAEMLHERALAEGVLRIRCQCSSFHRNSALHPVIEHLVHAAGFTASDSPAARLDKLESMVAEGTEDVAAVAPRIAALLSLPAGERYELEETSPEQHKARTLEAIATQIDGLARRRPVLLVFEDVQWADPTTLELLERLVERAEGVSVLVLLTARAGFQPPWPDHAHVTRLSLNRLPRAQVAAMLDRITGGKSLPDAVRDAIVERTDGVPLFVEELTRSVLESGQLEDRGDRYVSSAGESPVAIPASVQDSLMARLDRLCEGRDLVQLASVVGRSSPRALLAAVSSLAEADFERALSELVKADVLRPRRAGGEVHYEFRHALIQETAYQTMLSGTRRGHHEAIARALVDAPADGVGSPPEVVAHHFSEADLGALALPHWIAAVRRAAESNADVEAIAHYTRGLHALETLLDSDERARHELELRLAVGSSLMNVKGSATPEVAELYHGARALAERVGTAPQRFAALWGLWHHFHTSGQVVEERRQADVVLGLLGELEDPGLELQAHHTAWGVRHIMGDLAGSLEHAERGFELYDLHRDHSHAFLYAGHDPGVCAGCTSAVILWTMGYPDRALGRADETFDLAERVDHPFSTAMAYWFRALIVTLRGDSTSALAQAERMREFTAVHELGIWVVNARIMRSWILAIGNDSPEALQALELAVDERWRRGGRLRRSLDLGMLAEGCLTSSLYEQGLALADEAAEVARRGGEHRWLHMIVRVKADLLSRLPGRGQDAEEVYRESMRLAREQGARMVELRAATGLAQLLRERDERGAARDVLAPLHGWFTEGLDTVDLRRAKMLLGELA